MVTNGERCQQSALTSPTQSHWVNTGTHTVNQARPFIQTRVNRQISAYTVSHTVICLLLHQGFVRAFILRPLPLLCVCVCVCKIHLALLYFYYDVSRTTNLYDGGSAIFLTASIFIKPKRCLDFEKYDAWGTHVFHFSITSVFFSECLDYVITQ